MAAREMMASDLRENKAIGFHRRIEVRDEQGSIVARITLDQAVLE